jgi:hypothetical protein
VNEWLLSLFKKNFLKEIKIYKNVQGAKRKFNISCVVAVLEIEDEVHL